MDDSEQLAEALRSDKASKAIPLCVSLIYKHRDVEATLWEMIASLATQLRPPTPESVVRVGSVVTGKWICVKHGDKLRTVHYPMWADDLRKASTDLTVVLPRVRAVLIGDPGLDGRGRVHVLVGRNHHGPMMMSTVWGRLEALGV